MTARRTARAAFTLLELLAAVTIVGLLVGMCLSAIQQSRQTARRITCQSNLRQWTFAAHQYANVHNGRLPRRGQGVQATSILNRKDDWFNALPAFMESQSLNDLVQEGKFTAAGAWTCPELIDSGQPVWFAYGMNMWLSTWNAAKPDSIEKVGATSSMVFMADGPGDHCSLLPSTQAYSPVARHAQAVNLAFLDGHAETFSGDEVGCGVGDPLRPGIRWKVPNSVWNGPDQ